MMRVREQKKIRMGVESKRFIEKKKKKKKKKKNEEKSRRRWLLDKREGQPRNSKAELKNWAGTGGFTIFIFFYFVGRKGREPSQKNLPIFLFYSLHDL